MKSDQRRELFIELSAFISDFKPIDLLVTDVIDSYIVELLIRVGEHNLDWLLKSWNELKDKNLDFPTLWKDERGGPMLRNIIKLWYTGTWKELSSDWFSKYAESLDPTENFEHVVSTQSYIEGLVWVVLEAHPPGAKPPGFGSWSVPPKSSKLNI